MGGANHGSMGVTFSSRSSVYVLPKDNGSERLLSIPTVLGRVIQQALRQVLSPRFDPAWSEHSVGCRPNRSAQDALRQVQG